MNPNLCLIKPPESSRFNFGTFSLGVLAAAVRHTATVSIIDSTKMSFAEAIASVKVTNPDIVGITVMGLPSLKPAAQFISLLKSDKFSQRNGNRSLIILAGGHGASMSPEPLLRAGANAVLTGEGETTLLRIIEDGISPGGAGLACLVDGNVICGPPLEPISPLDKLRAPARDIMPLPPDGVHLMETSRGCPHACTFCETTRFYGRKWRPFSPERVAEEVRRLVVDYDAWIIQFADDNFAADPRRVIQICDKLKRGPLPAFIMASARADDLLSHPHLVPALAAARILRITIGVENVAPDMMALMDKRVALGTYREVFQLLKANGIFSVASFIVGLPGEQRKDRTKAVESALQVGADSAHFLPFMPFPGIPLSSGFKTAAPDANDVRDATKFTRMYMKHDEQKKRLAEAASKTDIRGMLARAALNKW